MNPKTVIENYINGNLKLAKWQARGFNEAALCLVAQQAGKSERAARRIAFYLKHPSQATFDAACAAEAEARQ